MKSQIEKWLLISIGPLLFIIHITLIYVLVLLGDTLVVNIISWSFVGIVKHSLFAAKLLEGIQLLSALGTAVAYALHLIYSLYHEGKHVVKAIRDGSTVGKNEVSL